MYKKIVITLIVILPLFYIFVGYPIAQRIPVTGTANSLRCFSVDSLKPFFMCSHDKLQGVPFIKHIFVEMNDLQNGFGILFLLVIFIQILLLVSIV